MGATERLSLDLPSELAAMLGEAVQRGVFGSESEAVTAILPVWRGDGETERNIDQISVLGAEGLAEADAGHFIEADNVHDELRAS